ncbi:MAG: TRAM domain-containing protein [Leptospiraceae bacterium]|nr:TRAM domain-containing protein [Leptospiraceae bacterium]MCK6380969.1 TRAM domain-containing protein [Leptospiraceae bacterium]NUM41008.1 TRAM domain-containing protein [Leptospiraceae bacterium]
MIHLYRILLSLFLTGVSLLVLYFGYIRDLSIYIYPALTFITSLIIFYGEGKLFPKLKGDFLFCSGIGAVIGLSLAYFLSAIFKDLHFNGIHIFLSFLFGLIGIRAGVEFAKDPGLSVFGGGGIGAFSLGSREKGAEIRDKILDTSVVIDGRILDIADTHFIDGPLILPNFVLREIQLISDSSDPIKRARGRRGLDMLNKLQRKGSIEVKITYTDYTDTREVDAKLIKLARDTGAKLVTNDFNLNKVAELQGVKVLNLNNLANALKPVVLPGEEIQIQVIKEGKDENQGIGYLEDGTMVVIENGGHLVGKDVKVNVTSIIQTAAGKMIFTKAIK